MSDMCFEDFDYDREDDLHSQAAELEEEKLTSDNSAMDAISALRDLLYACIRADAAGELSAIVDGSLLDRAKDVLKQHQ